MMNISIYLPQINNRILGKIYFFKLASALLIEKLIRFQKLRQSSPGNFI